MQRSKRSAKFEQGASTSPRKSSGSGLIHWQWRPAMNKPLNVAALPHGEALERAHVSGREIFLNDDSIQQVADAMWLNWVNVHMPIAVDQSDYEFDKLLEAMRGEFHKGLREAVTQCQHAA